MKRILSGKDMKNIDNFTISNIGIPSLVLMENAANAVVDRVVDIVKSKTEEVVAFCGVGNNGADGVAVIRILKNLGYQKLNIVIVGNEEKATNEFAIQIDIVNKINDDESINVIRCNEASKIEDVFFMVGRSTILIDAIFGIGITREITGIYRLIIDRINETTMYKIAVDIASGIDANTAKIMGVAIKCDETVTFGAYKIGMLLYEGANYSGKITCANIGFPENSYKSESVSKVIYSLEPDDVSAFLPERKDDSNKGTYGKITIIAGNEEMYGTAYMAASAAFRMGGGLIRVVTTANNKRDINTMLPEAIVNNIEDYKAAIDWCNALVIGPGMGVSERTYNILKDVLVSKKPVVIDADALNTLSENRDLFFLMHEDVIITPHLGEMSRISGYPLAYIKSNMIEVCNEIAKKYGINVIMKDSRTVITDVKGNTYINMTGNSGMAKAGSGDVLAGMTGACLAMSGNAKKAAVVAPYLHGFLGDLVKEELGEYAMMPTDMINSINRINTL